jgi:hypothetical protein
MSIVAPAVSNALYDAVGVRLHRAPFTPERVWRAVREADGSKAADGEAAADGHRAAGARADDGIPEWWTATEWTSRARRPR